MTTTELIDLLRSVEIGGISGRPRTVRITIADIFHAYEPKISVSSTGDGLLGPEVWLLIEKGDEDE